MHIASYLANGTAQLTVSVSDLLAVKLNTSVGYKNIQ